MKGTVPRKIVVGTTMYAMWHTHPGLEKRLEELGGFVDAMARKAAAAYPGKGLDLAALPEMAVSGGLEGAGRQVAFPLEGPVLDRMGAKAREHHCYIVVPLYLVEGQGRFSNAAVLIGRDGQAVGIYRKVFAVVNPGSAEPEAGVTPGREFPAFDCDFGRVGIQICYDMAFDEGWRTLGGKGVDLVVWPTQWPGRVHPARRALENGYFVLSSTWRNNASLVDPTGHVIRDTRTEGVFVEQIDLTWEIVSWQPTLRNGKLFDERFGPRAGYRYSEEEDCGIFWSNDPDTPVSQMVRELGLETKAVELKRAREALVGFRGGEPVLDA